MYLVVQNTLKTKGIFDLSFLDNALGLDKQIHEICGSGIGT